MTCVEEDVVNIVCASVMLDSSLKRSNMARFTCALGYAGCSAIMPSIFSSTESIAEESEEEVMSRTISFCWASSMESWEDGMLGCEGRLESTAEASFERATEEGRVSGSKSAFRMRASFALSVVLGRVTAMMELEMSWRSMNCKLK